MERVHCPRHDERTPSCVIYDSYAWCFGGCGRIELAELGVDVKPAPKRAPEDLGAALTYIAGLPLVRIRGLDLPADSEGYYITWPSGDYYKKRRFIGDGGNKYYCPRGHKKPLYVPRLIDSPVLAVVEGELNALSLAKAEPNFSVCSPGGVGDFSRFSSSVQHLRLTMSSFLIIVDRDGPGLDAGLKLKEELLRLTPYVQLELLERDCNELLAGGEIEQAARQWEARMGVQARVRPK